MDIDLDRCRQAIKARDPRFDGWVVCGLKTTGICGREAAAA